jgi:integrase
MGHLVRVWKKSPFPAGAKIGRNGTVTWTVKGKKRTGKLSGNDMVSHQVDTWSAEFTDETGKVKRVSTKTKNRSAAEQKLAQYEAEVVRIKSGVVTREELTKAKKPQITLDEAVERFRTKMVANGNTEKHTDGTVQQVLSLFGECEIDSLVKIRCETIERWIADEINKKVRSLRTINAYLVAVKSFAQYLVVIEALPNNPLKPIRKLNQEIDLRKKRRAMTSEEVERFMKTVTTRKYRTKKQTAERALIYRLLLGTGLRSTELSLLTPNQIDFERNRLTIEAAKTKNKKADVLPMRADLVQSVKEWVEAHGIPSQERIFRYNRDSIRRSFYGDLKAAGIERKDPDGRSIDVHSLRKTFGTMLARAGVPLTTVQRLMRHSTPTMTAKLYIDVDAIDMTQALDALPTF